MTCMCHDRQVGADVSNEYAGFVALHEDFPSAESIRIPLLLLRSRPL